MTGGEIHHNSAGYGGGVHTCAAGGTGIFYLTSPATTANIHDNTGNGANVRADGTFKVNGVTGGGY